MTPGRPKASPAPAALPRLAGFVLSRPGQPVFVTGGPPRTPFGGEGPAHWSNPAYALHHAHSWDSPFVLGPMLPLEPSADPHRGQVARLLERHRRTLETLAEGPLPVVAQVWGPLTLAGIRVGLEELLRRTRSGDDLAEIMAEGVEATLVATEAALDSRPLVLWVAEPTAVLVDPDTLERAWLAPMRSLTALARMTGAEPVVHMSGSATHVLPVLKRAGVAGVSITADTPLATARELLGEHSVLFGNLDSMRLLDRDSDWLAARAREMVETMRGSPYVVTPGSALSNHQPVEPLAAFVDTARAARGT